ncbi:MAG: response regulator transcription factor [Epsilonproteobacteria bacterium]|nr:response regulator transcription factor [Campylobacterota bacterium]
MNVLLLEDDAILSEIISEHLAEKGYAVRCAYDGEDAYEQIQEHPFDFMLFDVNIPRLSGFDLLALLRSQQIDIPIIFITSLNSANDLKKGFDLGCDDYLKKPFELLELDARIEHLIRIHRLGDNRIIIDTHRYLERQSYELIDNGTRHRLSKKEFEMLEYLLLHKDETLSHAKIIANLWLNDEVPTDATIRTYIKNLRALLGKDFLTTIKGVGYRINI